MKKIMVMVAVVLSACVCLSATTNTLDSLKGSYDMQCQVVLAKYGKALDAALVTLKKAGNLDGVVIIDTEKNRFEAEQSVLFPSNSMSKVIYGASDGYYNSLMSLMRQYGVALDLLTKDLVRRDRIEEAKAVKAEKDKVVFMLADAETKMPKVVVLEATTAPKHAAKKMSLPDGTVEFKGHHYKGFIETITWQMAQARCQKLGGHLVAIADAEENDFVLNVVGDKNGWIGLRRIGEKWTWVDKSSLSYANWAAGEPNSSKVSRGDMESENAAILYGRTKGPEIGQWNDLVGSKENGAVSIYICEWDF